jgi:hypothetical protein
MMRYEILCFYSVIAANQKIANLENGRIMRTALEVLSLPSRCLSFAGKLTRVREHMRFMTRKVDVRIENGLLQISKANRLSFLNMTFQWTSRSSTALTYAIRNTTHSSRRNDSWLRYPKNPQKILDLGCGTGTSLCFPRIRFY